ncbi:MULTISPECIES: hypothetical protein [unclassified Spiroplasma]|uniref:hypothetical protein n=1 Tax=unclassified Spiroplasma TaxID=2637901 RepID=UPI0030CA7D2B
MKTWIKTNFQKISLSFAVITGVTGLILGIVSYNKNNQLTYFYDYDHEAHWGATIWARPVSNKHKITLYWASNKLTDDAVKWDGIYPDGYFDN